MSDLAQSAGTSNVDSYRDGDSPPEPHSSSEAPPPPEEKSLAPPPSSEVPPSPSPSPSPPSPSPPPAPTLSTSPLPTPPTKSPPPSSPPPPPPLLLLPPPSPPQQPPLSSPPPPSSSKNDSLSLTPPLLASPPHPQLQNFPPPPIFNLPPSQPPSGFSPPPPVSFSTPPPSGILAPTPPAGSSTPPSSGAQPTPPAGVTPVPPTRSAPPPSWSYISPATPNLSSPASSSGQSSSGGFVFSHPMVVTVAVGVIALTICFFSILHIRRKRMSQHLATTKAPPASSNGELGITLNYEKTTSKQGTPAGDDIVPSISLFTYEEVERMTQGFTPENIVGKGGFGCVYKGRLPNGRAVAVKQLIKLNDQGEQGFWAEVEVITRVHHRNLVSLVGHCATEEHRVLIYEFVSNKTLTYHLHGKGLPVLEWDKRFRIAVEAAYGLAYLHEDCHPRIIHRDIKADNILLDDAYNPKVADFGLAKPSDTTKSHVSTRVMGTFGYLAPEYANTGQLTDKSDVFSFGVVLLELITGRKAVISEYESLADWARPLMIEALKTGDIRELVDPRLRNNYDQREMVRMIEVASASTRHTAFKRPRMVQVARALDSDREVLDLSNGVPVGDSTAYDSQRHNTRELERFRRMPFQNEFESSDYEMISGKN